MTPCHAVARLWLVTLLCIAAAAGAAAATVTTEQMARRMRAIELEAELARKPALYLVLDPAQKRLGVRSRGVELGAVEMREISRLVFQPLLGSGVAPPLPAPALWTVIEGPGDTDRETIAPTTLRPYSDDEDEEAPSSTAAAVVPKRPGETEKPTSYRVGLDVGWQLLLTPEAPRLGWYRRFGAAVRDGWLRLQGEEPAHPPLLALVVAPEDAQRFHHLFRTGTPILVLAETTD